MPEKHGHDQHYEMIKKLKLGKVLLPVIIGLAVVAWLMFRDFNPKYLTEITFTWRSVFWLSAALMLIFMVVFWYMARIKSLCDNEISWLQAFRIIILWEFTSAISPSTVGGTALAVIFLHKEGLTVGRSTSIVLLTSFLDELYFIVLFPLLVLLVGAKDLLLTSYEGVGSAIMNNLFLVALLAYFIILIWVVAVGYGLFVKPEAIRKLIISIFSLPLIRRWKEAAIRSGDDIVVSSHEISRKSAGFWRRALFTTFMTWTSRYLVMNAILAAFFTVSDHLLLFAKQVILWIMMIISPTPGGSGFAEVMISKYISELIPVDTAHAHGVSLAMAIIWRAVTYYPFLLAGVFVVPGWIARKFKKPSKQ